MKRVGEQKKNILHSPSGKTCGAVSCINVSKNRSQFFNEKYVLGTFATIVLAICGSVFFCFVCLMNIILQFIRKCAYSETFHIINNNLS